MGLNLSSIYQRPYVLKDGRDLVKKRQDEESSKTASQTRREEESLQNSRSRGLQYVENNQDGFVRNANPLEAQLWQKEIYQNALANQAVQTVNPKYSRANSSINIAQILKDFRNTAAAIGTPDDLNEEVDGYLELIERQVTKDNPNTRLIKSNLKNASTILDGYISATLEKESKVVENWVDALFLQNIDFNYNEEDINPQFLVKFPEGSAERINKSKSAGSATENVSGTEETPPEEKLYARNIETKVYIPEDSELKSLFLQSKKLAYANEPGKAIENYRKALDRADIVGDTETKSKIFYEIGKIYDDYNYPAQALTSYNKSIENTSDNNVKTKAHYSMAQIYDDVNQIKPALDHYFISAAYGGESENLAAQSTSLARMGNIFSDMYEDEAFDYLNTAKDIASETDNSKVKGFVFASLGRAYERFGEPQEALKSYSDAVRNYTDASSPLKTAQNYLSAADIMIDFNSSNKARGLLTKAKQYASNTNDETLLEEIDDRLMKLSA